MDKKCTETKDCLKLSGILPANYVDVRMEQLLQRILTNYEMAKDEASRRQIIELLAYALDAMPKLTKVRNFRMKKGFKDGKRHIGRQSDGSLKPEDSGWCE